MKKYSNFIYNERRRFVFAYVPKVACTNWKAIMRYVAGHEDYLNNRLAHDKMNGGLRYIDFTGQDVSLLSDPGIQKYAFVRSPYSRALSSYLNKIERHLNFVEWDPNNRWVNVVQDIDQFRQRALDTNIYPNVSFEVFLLWIRDSKSRFGNDEHWRQQSILLRWPTVEFDFVGRFENLDADARHLLSEIGCDVPFPTQADIKFPSTGANLKLAQYMSSTCRQLVDQIFSADFTNFDYAKGTLC